MTTLWRWLHDLAAHLRDDLMSSKWLAQQARLSERVEFHGVEWRWPVRRED